MEPIRVLIIEDDEDIIDLIRSVLEPGCECFTGSNGLEGLQQAVRGEPDIVICDIMMPVMDGWEFMRRLRAMRGYEKMPVIFLSALASRENIRDGYDLGAMLYVTKPIDPMRFRRLIDLFISDHSIAPRAKRLPIDRVRSLARGAAPQAGMARSLDQEQEEAPPRPAQRTQAPQTAASSAGASYATGAGSGVGRPAEKRAVRILVVEDDRDISHMLHTALELDYEVLEAGDGIAAIDKAMRYKPDLFIIDGMLPRMTGYQLTVMLKKNPEFMHSPIIFISGKASTRDQEYIQRLGITHFLPKPFTAEKIRRMVDEMVHHPEFNVKQQRVSTEQIELEKLQHLETHRGSRTFFMGPPPERR